MPTRVGKTERCITSFFLDNGTTNGTPNVVFEHTSSSVLPVLSPYLQKPAKSTLNTFRKRDSYVVLFWLKTCHSSETDSAYGYREDVSNGPNRIGMIHLPDDGRNDIYLKCVSLAKIESMENVQHIRRHNNTRSYRTSFVRLRLGSSGLWHHVIW
jgi:hypothetical protein